MTTCTEFAVFKVPPENSARVVELSKQIFSEMNADEQVILSSQVYNAQTIMWNYVGI